MLTEAEAQGEIAAAQHTYGVRRVWDVAMKTLGCPPAWITHRNEADKLLLSLLDRN